MSNRTEFLSNVMINALEGGINYWAFGRGLKTEMGTNKYGDEDEFFLSVQVKDREGPSFPDGDARNGWIVVDHDKLTQAIEKVIDGSVRCGTHYRNWIRDDWKSNEMSSFDAGCADIVFQVAAFGEVVFG